MKPDRSNYEIWIIDWLDGKLDPEATRMLNAFLEANPDLREEAESLSLSGLKKGTAVFQGRDDLKRNIEDLPLSQVEYLSVKYLEKDITPEQMEDLRTSLEINKDYRKSFDLIQKIKLVPQDVTFKNKALLKKQTPGIKVIRLVPALLSAAATIAILITGYIYLQKNDSQKPSDAEQIAVSQYKGEPFEITTRKYKEPEEKPAAAKVQTPTQNPVISQVIASEAPGPLSEPVRFQAITVPVANVKILPEVTPDISVGYLASTNNPYTPPIALNDDRSRLSRFIARNFREKFLKEPVMDESPLKTYEIAEAGIEGLNKLLGWKMALVTTNDEQGEVKSVYFSSRMIKFNAPVKKTEPQP